MGGRSALREADFYALKIHFDQETFLHLYFGSPMPRFRDRLTQWLGVDFNREIYVLGSKKAPRFDLRSGTIEGMVVENPTSKTHQLLAALLRDFYEPLRAASLFAELYPNEHFDIENSPDRVEKVVRRARTWLKENSVPARIEIENGFYNLVCTGPISFRISLDRDGVDPTEVHFNAFEKKMQQMPVFTAKQARESTNLPKTSLRRILDWGIAHNRLEIDAPSARRTRYTWKKKGRLGEAA